MLGKRVLFVLFSKFLPKRLWLWQYGQLSFCCGVKSRFIGRKTKSKRLSLNMRGTAENFQPNSRDSLPFVKSQCFNLFQKNGMDRTP